MKVDDIITLDNNEKYLLLEKVEYKKGTYFLAVPYVDDKLDHKRPTIFHAYKENNENFVELVDDQSTIIEVTRKLKNNN